MHRTSRLLAVLVLVAACGGQSVVSPTPAAPMPSHSSTPSRAPAPAPDPTSTAAPTDTATAAPASATAGAAATSLPAPVTALEPGRYAKAGFEPALTFEVGEGWSAQQATNGFFDIQQNPGSLDAIAVQFANTGAPFADLLAQAIANRDNLSVGEPEIVSIDGHEGIQVVVETTDPVDTNPPIFRPVLDISAGPLSIASARRLQVTLLNRPELGAIGPSNTVLAILVGGSIAEWDGTLEVATPVVESIEFV